MSFQNVSHFVQASVCYEMASCDLGESNTVCQQNFVNRSQNSKGVLDKEFLKSACLHSQN